MLNYAENVIFTNKTLNDKRYFQKLQVVWITYVYACVTLFHFLHWKHFIHIRLLLGNRAYFCSITSLLYLLHKVSIHEPLFLTILIALGWMHELLLEHFEHCFEPFDYYELF